MFGQNLNEKCKVGGKKKRNRREEENKDVGLLGVVHMHDLKKNHGVYKLLPNQVPLYVLEA